MPRQALNKLSSTWLYTLSSTDTFLTEQSILWHWISNYRQTVEKKKSVRQSSDFARKKIVQMWLHIAVFDSNSSQSGDKTSN